MSDVQQKAATFARVHEAGDLLLLPTVWDAWSARLADSAGFQDLTVGSHPVGDALGPGDGEAMDFADYMRTTRRSVNAVDVPVSVDVESGYGLTRRSWSSAPSRRGPRVSTSRTPCAVRTVACASARSKPSTSRTPAPRLIDFVINGRTDAPVHGTKLFEDPLAEAAERFRLLERACARSDYPVGLPDGESAAAVVVAVSVPVNATAHPVNGAKAGSLEQLRTLGVHRATFGPLWQAALAEESTRLLAAWKA